MVPTPKKRKALVLQMLPRNRTWDCEYDIYSHLQEKNRVLKCGTKKFDYFNTLLQCFIVEDPKGDPELVQFMDSLHSIVKSQMLHHLEHSNIENTAEEKGVIVDPQHKYFMDHVRPHGKSYVLDIPEDGVCVKYEPESSLSPERMKNQSICSEILVIKDSDDDDDAACQIVEHCWQEHHKGKETTLFKEKLMEELKAPFCEEEYTRLLHNITVRKPVQRHRELRGGFKIYDESRIGKSYLDCNVDLAEKIKAAHGDHPRVLNLLRGFFYWLKNLSHEGAFLPWKDPSWLDVLPQQLEG